MTDVTPTDAGQNGVTLTADQLAIVQTAISSVQAAITALTTSATSAAESLTALGLVSTSTSAPSGGGILLPGSPGGNGGATAV